MKGCALVFLLLVFFCAPLHLLMGTLPHSGHGEHHHTEVATAFDHATSMSEVEYIAYVLLVCALLTFFLLSTLYTRVSLLPASSSGYIPLRSPPGVLLWLSRHFTSPPQSRV